MALAHDLTAFDGAHLAACMGTDLAERLVLTSGWLSDHILSFVQDETTTFWDICCRHSDGGRGRVTTSPQAEPGAHRHRDYARATKHISSRATVVPYPVIVVGRIKRTLRGWLSHDSECRRGQERGGLSGLRAEPGILVRTAAARRYWRVHAYRVRRR